MAGGNGSAPRKSFGGSGKKLSKKQQQQMKQLGVMAGVLVVCAILVTWTVLLMMDRYQQNQLITEQNSTVDFLEVSRNDDDDPEETRQTTVPEFTERTTTATTDGTGTETSTTKMTNATAPKRVTVQSVSFSKKKTTTTKAKTTNQTTSSGKTTSQTTTDGAEQTTQTTAQQLTMDSAPTAAEIPYNELLALYLGAEAQGNEAFFVDSASPAIVLRGEKAYYVISEADDYNFSNMLGGTGDADENPWQTGTSFQIKQYEDGDPYIYYASTGNAYQVLGYYNMKTCDNVWARLHYYQVGVDWEVEYHIFHDKLLESTDDARTEIYTGTCAAEALYESAAALDQIEASLKSQGISAGAWSDYQEVEADQQRDALWSKAGDHNKGFAPQSGESYAAVCGTGDAVMYSEADSTSAAVASLPAGTLVSIPKNALPLGTAMVSVQVNINGTWVSGYMQPDQLIAWSE